MERTNIGPTNDKQKEKEVPFDGQMNVRVKVAPSLAGKPNRKGHNISDFKVLVDTKDLPFTWFDHVDRFLYDLAQLSSNFQKKEDKKKKGVFLYHNELMKFIPVKIQTQDGGKKSKTNKKNKTRKYRGKNRKTVKRAT